jgi:hypothetical protein
MATFTADIPDNTFVIPETIECPLCLGRGELTRAEVLDRLGAKDLARVAQLSAEQAFGMLLKQEKQAEQARWGKFEVELTKRLNEVTSKHQAELQKLQSEKNQLDIRLKEWEKASAATVANAKKESKLEAEEELRKELAGLNAQIAELEAADRLSEKEKETAVQGIKVKFEAQLNAVTAKANQLDRQVKDYLREIGEIRERNKELEAEMAKVARVGKREELDFAEDVRSWPGIYISDKLPRYGDYLLAFRDGAGNALDPKIVVDNKDKSSVTELDIKKLIRDCMERNLTVGVIVTREETQLRHSDKELRWAQEDNVWLLRTTRAWLQRDLEVLKPIFERMREEGPDFLQKNAALAEEIRRTFIDLDEIEAELKKAGKAIEKAKTATVSYRTKLSALCDSASPGKKAS